MVPLAWYRLLKQAGYPDLEWPLLVLPPGAPPPWGGGSVIQDKYVSQVILFLHTHLATTALLYCKAHLIYYN